MDSFSLPPAYSRVDLGSSEVKGTETRGHTMKEIGIYFPDDRPKTVA